MRVIKLLVASEIIVFAIFFLMRLLIWRRGLTSAAGLRSAHLSSSALLHRYERTKWQRVADRLVELRARAIGRLPGLHRQFNHVFRSLFAHSGPRRFEHESRRDRCRGRAVQAVWAPLVFSKISFLLLQGDASVVGWLLGFVIPERPGEARSSIHQADITSSLRRRALLFIIFLWRRCVG